MLYVDIPTLSELKSLSRIREDACVSIYLPTTPVTAEIEVARIEFGNLRKEAIAQLERAAFDKRRLVTLDDRLADLADDDDLWAFQAHSLAVLATPSALRTYRLPNRLVSTVEVSDRFHLNPLLRAITFPNEAFVLALSENAVRLVAVCPELPAVELRIAGLPANAADALGRVTLNKRSPQGRLQGSEGQKVLLRSFARQVDRALRPTLASRETPLILAATEPLASIYRSLNTHPGLVAAGIVQSPDRTSDAELAAAARPILDGLYASEIASLRALYAERSQQDRTTSDIALAARAATRGAIEALLVDIDASIPGTVDEETGAVAFAAESSAASYSVIDEIARRALLTGARVLGVRKDDIPGGAALAAILRYALTS